MKQFFIIYLQVKYIYGEHYIRVYKICNLEWFECYIFCVICRITSLKHVYSEYNASVVILYPYDCVFVHDIK